MITDCPACHRQFRVYAWQLSAAGGLVQCGFCGERYNALERLHDRPLPVERQVAATTAPEDEPEFHIPDEPELSAPDRTETVTTAAMTPEHPGAGGGIDAAMEQPVGDGTDEEIPPELLLTDPPASSPLARLLWSLGILLLLVVGSIQVAWFNRDSLLERYPRYRPLVQDLCNRYGCDPVREYDLDAIVLLNRDVRDHPRYTDTLLVNATLENQSEHVQPYPRIRLLLYDTDGNISGYRTFSPGAYLDSSVDIEGGMPVQVPVHIVLELTGATEAAVSFEFDFIRS